jgi:hypothetical protein
MAIKDEELFEYDNELIDEDQDQDDNSEETYEELEINDED